MGQTRPSSSSDHVRIGRQRTNEDSRCAAVTLFDLKRSSGALPSNRTDTHDPHKSP
jgi:hypothetical protein